MGPVVRNLVLFKLGWLACVMLAAAGQPLLATLLQQQLLDNRERCPPLAPGTGVIACCGGNPCRQTLPQRLQGIVGAHCKRMRARRASRSTEATRPMPMKFTSRAKRP